MFILVRQTICGAMVIRVGKLQFIGLIGGADPNLGATRPRVGIAMLGLEAPTW
jgi:hypothetical protein